MYDSERESKMIATGVVDGMTNARGIARLEKAVKSGKSDLSVKILRDLHEARTIAAAAKPRGSSPGGRRGRSPESRRRLSAMLDLPGMKGADYGGRHRAEHIRNLQRPATVPSELLPAVRTWGAVDFPFGKHGARAMPRGLSVYTARAAKSELIRDGSGGIMPISAACWQRCRRVAKYFYTLLSGYCMYVYRFSEFRGYRIRTRRL